jgi:hypothetical protein
VTQSTIADALFAEYEGVLSFEPAMANPGEHAPTMHARGLRRLAVENRHPHDDRVVFDEDLHVYFVDGARYPTSVSGVVHQFFPSFDAAACVDKYYDKWRSDKQSRYYQFIAYLENVLQLPTHAAKAEIALNWNSSGKKASGDGTATHLAIELDLNCDPVAPEHKASVEFQQYEAWRLTHPTWVPYRTEWSVFDESTLLCGQIDSVWQDVNTKKFYMVDWKRVEKLEKTNNFGERGYPPMQKHHNTNFAHYTLQQSLYAWMLQQNYGIQIEEMYLLQVHPSISCAKELEISYIEDEVEEIMSERRAKVRGGDIKTIQASASRKRSHGDAEAAGDAAAAASDSQRERNAALRELYTRLASELGV